MQSGESTGSEQDPVATTRPVLVLHWGKTGAGPSIARDLIVALRDAPGVTVYSSFASNAELSHELETLAPSFRIRTYKTRVGLIAGLPRLVLKAFGLRAFIRRNRIQVVISPMLSIWQSLALPLILPPGVKYISTIHDFEPHLGESHWLLSYCLRQEYKRADGIMTFSEYVSTQIKDRHMSRARVRATVHPAMSHTRRPVRSPRAGTDSSEGRVIVGTFGRLHAYKGIDIFVDAMNELKARRPGVQAVVCGSGLRESDAIVSANPAIDWRLGWVAEDRVNEVVGGFDVLVLPYREASQSGVFAVALAEGVPVVVTPVGGLIEQAVGTGAGVVAESLSPESVAAAIEMVLDDHDLKEELARNAMAASRRDYSWERVAEDYIELAKALQSP